MIVVIGIIGIITSIGVTSQSSFNKSLVLTNAAYDVALTIQSAQGYGISTRAAAGATNVGYGVHFSTADKTKFTLFADINADLARCHGPITGRPSDISGDCVFQLLYGGTQTEKVTDYILNNGVYVSKICSYNSSWSCSLSSADIVFARPNPDPFFSVDGSFSATTQPSSVCIELASVFAQPSDPHRYIKVEASGMIYTHVGSCT